MSQWISSVSTFQFLSRVSVSPKHANIGKHIPSRHRQLYTECFFRWWESKTVLYIVELRLLLVSFLIRINRSSCEPCGASRTLKLVWGSPTTSVLIIRNSYQTFDYLYGYAREQVRKRVRRWPSDSHWLLIYPRTYIALADSRLA